METWINTEIAAGLKRLLALKLERAPGARVIRHTLDEWCKAIGEDRQWISYRDAMRFRKAFTTLAKTFRSWPVPADFIAAIPPILQETTTASVASNKDLAHAQAEIAKIAAVLDGKAAAAGPDK